MKPTFEVEVAEPVMLRPVSVVVENPPFAIESATFVPRSVDDAIANALSD